jgi:hypothetical protein
MCLYIQIEKQNSTSSLSNGEAFESKNDKKVFSIPEEDLSYGTIQFW